MYVIISNNLEDYEDESESCFMVCDTVKEANYIVDTLCKWVEAAQDYILECNTNGPLIDIYTYTSSNPIPFDLDINTLHIPYLHSMRSKTSKRDLKRAFYFYEVPFYKK